LKSDSELPARPCGSRVMSTCTRGSWPYWPISLLSTSSSNSSKSTRIASAPIQSTHSSKIPGRETQWCFTRTFAFFTSTPSVASLLVSMTKE